MFRRAVNRTLTMAASLGLARRAAVTVFDGDADAFTEKVKQGAVIVDFYTDWCGPCKAAAPKFEALSEKHPSVTFMKTNVDEAQDIAASLNIRSIPTFIAFKDGKVVGHCEGAQMDEVEKLIKQL